MEPLTQEQSDLLDKYPHLRDVWSNPKLSPHDKKLAALPVLRQLHDEQAKTRRQLKAKQDQLALATRLIGASEVYKEWCKQLTPKLEKNDCSRLHQLVHYLKHGRKMFGEEIKLKGGDADKFPWHEVIPFVVQHDWAAAFANATDYDGNYRIPYPMCAFEFRISGRSVTALAVQDEEELSPRYTFYSEMGGCWLTEDENPPPTYAFVESQVKAICVSLEAEVSTSVAVRAPEKLNKKREAEGKIPLFSFRIINLAHRHRISNPSSTVGMVHGKKRLHFRRGHWRHFAESKTWVRWTLVGNPELGFIDKEYRL